jgi:hypothetical protein
VYVADSARGVRSIAVAWIGFGGAVIAALITAAVAWRQTSLSQRQAEMAGALAESQARTKEELARLESALDTERHQPEALFDRSLRAVDVLTTYREPLAAAAYDLQSRIYNILCMDFFGKWGNRNDRAQEAVNDHEKSPVAIMGIPHPG